MEDIQDLLHCNDKTDVEQKEASMKANIWIQELKHRLGKEEKTPEKQKNAADKFFQVIGQD